MKRDHLFGFILLEIFINFENIKNTDWTEVFHCTDANVAYMNFERIITTAFNESFRLVRLS